MQMGRESVMYAVLNLKYVVSVDATLCFEFTNQSYKPFMFVKTGAVYYNITDRGFYPERR